MKMSVILSLLFAQASFAVQTVPSVDLNRYVGKWYEVVSIPASFQRKCIKDTTAEYKKLPNGKIDVLNSCTQASGKRQNAHALAVIKNTTTNAELGVSFVPFFNQFGWFQGQYKVLALGENYEYALVGEDKLKFGWILSRTPQISIDTLAVIEEEIRRQGYDSCLFLTSLQTGGNFAKRQPLCEVVKQ